MEEVTTLEDTKNNNNRNNNNCNNNNNNSIYKYKDNKYVIEHLEGDDLGVWCRMEYTHMCEILGLAPGVCNSRLTFTNFIDENFNAVSDKYKPACFKENFGQCRETFEWDRVCLIDMDAPQQLSTGDTNKFDVFVFGGILGNVPSDDRTSEVRIHKFIHRRHLDALQMTTNTAVLVTKLIMEDGLDLSDIPFLDEPEISTVGLVCVTLVFNIAPSS
eukprot:GHVQ01038981.1.p1 GENE.GHVQ01038981.1~~GHVQ01038981.1.p1  ORF type:complete len:216 (-),score=41.34 GHVQ01038981.1:984-1631(-)